MHYIQKQIPALCLLIIFSMTRMQSQNTLGFEGKLTNYIEVIHKNNHFNGEVLVAKGDTVLFQKVIGQSSFEHQLPLKKEQKYKIASITKSFTATLIGMAMEEEKLQLEDKAIQFITTLSPKFKEITITQLLQHTSGLAHHEGMADYWPVKSKLQMNTTQVLTEINGLDLKFVPGTGQQYSSLGYYLLAVILENVYGATYELLLQNKILKKLNMRNTGGLHSLAIRKGMVSGYHLVQDDSLVVAPYRNYSALKGAGDLYATSKDILKFNTSFFSVDLLKEKTKKKLFGIEEKEINAMAYGKGWYISEKPHKKYTHGGGTWGFSSHNALYPNERISIVILSNISRLPITGIATAVEKIVFNDSFDLPKVGKKIHISEAALKSYVGRYSSKTNAMSLHITKIGNQLFLKLGRNPAFEIYAEGKHKFFGKKVAVKISFNTEENTIIGLTARRSGTTFHFKKELH